MSYLKQSIGTFAALVALFVCGCILDILPNHIFFLHNISGFYFIFLAVILLLYFRSSVIDRKMRWNLTLIAGLILFWFVVRLAKYAVFAESDFMSRILWYAYYIPMLGIPHFSFCSALNLGKTAGKSNRLTTTATGLITIVFIGLVLTNDLHGLIFIFENGFVKNLQNYSYGILFYILTAWSYLLLAISLAIIIIKSQVTASRKLSFILAIYSVAFAFWLVLLALDMRPKFWGHNVGEFPETVCFLVGGLWLLCLKTGLVPHNSGYGKIFSVTSLAALIADADYKVVYRSPSASTMTTEQLAAEEPFLLDKNTEVFRQKVPGGYAYIQQDLTELNKINEQLDDVNDALTEENELIRLENELKEKRSAIEVKSKTYDSIAVKVLPQSEKIEALVNRALESPESFDKNMPLVAVYICYIKRISNLMLLASENEKICRKELQLALFESARYLGKTGIIAEVNSDESAPLLPAKALVEAYFAFQKILEEALPTLRALYVAFVGNTMKIIVEGAEVTLPGGVSGSVEIDGDTAFVKIDLEKEGQND